MMSGERHVEVVLHQNILVVMAFQENCDQSSGGRVKVVLARSGI